MHTLKLNDRLAFADKLATSKPGFWARTQIIGGYGLRTNKLGVSSLDEVIFETENMVPLIGVQYAMEAIFGVKGTLPVVSLNDSMGIGAQGSLVLPTGNYPHAYGQRVCLFGVGTGGAAENNITALEVKYNDTNVSDMIPFRFTTADLGIDERDKYFGKKNENGYTAYYLKRFDNDPIIRHLYKDGEGDEDGSALDGTYFENPGNFGVQSFTEACLTISRKDIREFFDYIGNIEESRINSLGLYSAVYDETLGDYANIQLFSKLNIPTEPLALSKDMNIIYRVFGA